MKERLSLDTHVAFCFESPSGDGLKCGVRVATGAERHSEAFLGVQRYLHSTYDIRCDDACKDVSRLCFLSSDPDIRVNENVIPLDGRAWNNRVTVEPDEEDQGDAPAALPLDAFPKVIQQLASSCAEVYQVDAALPAVAALTILAAALGKSVKCIGAVNGRETPCNMFSVIAAPSGYGKGVVGIVAKPLTTASSEMVKLFESKRRPQLRADIGIAEAKKRKLLGEHRGGDLKSVGEAEARTQLGPLEANIEKWNFEAAQAPSLYTGSATGAALGVALKRNAETLLSLALEAGDAIRVAAGRFASDGKADYDLLLSGYTGEPFAESRITRNSVTLEAPCLTVLWAVQPTLLRELYGTQEAQERGLLARINVLPCDDDITPFDDGVFREVPAALEHQWGELLRAALELRKSGRTISFRADAEAKEVFRIFHNEAVALRNGEGRESEAKLKRSRENAVRIALVIAAAHWLVNGAKESDPILTAEHAARGVAIAEFFLAASLNLTRSAMAEQRAVRLEQVLSFVSQAGGSITLRRLRDHHNVGEGELRQIVATHPEQLRIETFEPGAKGGRPSARLIAIKNLKT